MSRRSSAAALCGPTNKVAPLAAAEAHYLLLNQVLPVVAMGLEALGAVAAEVRAAAYPTRLWARRAVDFEASSRVPLAGAPLAALVEHRDGAAQRARGKGGEGRETASARMPRE